MLRPAPPFADFWPRRITPPSVWRWRGGASQEAVKQAFRTLSKQHHPDKPSGDAEKFLTVRRAQQALNTVQKQDNYNRRLAKRLRSLAPRTVDAAVRMLERYWEDSVRGRVIVEHATDRRIVTVTPDEAVTRLQLSAHFHIKHEEARQLLPLLLIRLNQELAQRSLRPFVLSGSPIRSRPAARGGRRAPWGFWPRVSSATRRRLVQALADELGKPPAALRVADFERPRQELDGQTLNGLLTLYARVYRVPPRQGIQWLLRDLALGPHEAVPLSSGAAALEYVREGFVFWDTVPLDVQRRLVDMAALELGRSPSALRVSDFRKSVKAFDGHSLAGLLKHYRGLSRSQPDALRRIKTTLWITSALTPTPVPGAPTVDSAAPSTAGLEELPVARERTTELALPSSLDVGA